MSGKEEIGSGDRFGTVHFGWEEPPTFEGLDTIFEFQMPYGWVAYLLWDEEFGFWKMAYEHNGKPYMDHNLFKDSSGLKVKRALDEGSGAIVHFTLGRLGD